MGGMLAAYAGAAGLAIVAFIHSEAWIITAVALLGPIWAFIVLTVVMTVLANGIILALETRGEVKFARKLMNRAHERQASMNPRLKRIVGAGKISGVLVSAAILGALATAFLIHALGYRKPHNYLLASVGSLLFSATWVGVYSGAIVILKHLARLV